MLSLVAAALMMSSESVRPVIHFTAQRGWLNDPNGLVYFKGEYHLFFQHNPVGTQWGNMTWGHAISKDLVHWQALPSAIEPDERGTIFSGSAVVDSRNDSGFGKGAMVCFYTAAGGTNDASKGKPFTQCLAWSADGRSFHKLDSNPVLPHQEGENRDPKVVWDAERKRWLMALYLSGDRYGLFVSHDLKQWSKLNEVAVPGSGECPDLFELPYGRDRKWVFWSASGSYLIGRLDASGFHPETDPIASYRGNTGYAAQTYFNAPYGRHIQIAWMRGTEFPGCDWNQQMSVPVELSLHPTADGPRLAFQPVKEIARDRIRLRPPFDAGSGALEALLQVRGKARLTVMLDGRPLVYDSGRLTFENVTTNVAAADALDLHIVADRASIEIFADRGLVYMPFNVPPTPGPRRLSISGDVVSADVYELR